jgi:hypothetical protein
VPRPPTVDAPIDNATTPPGIAEAVRKLAIWGLDHLDLLSQSVAVIIDGNIYLRRRIFQHAGAEMDLTKSGDAMSRFLAYIEGLARVMRDEPNRCAITALG